MLAPQLRDTVTIARRTQAISRDVLCAMGGQLVITRSSRGAVFSFSLPIWRERFSLEGGQPPVSPGRSAIDLSVHMGAGTSDASAAGKRGILKGAGSSTSGWQGKRGDTPAYAVMRRELNSDLQVTLFARGEESQSTPPGGDDAALSRLSSYEQQSAAGGGAAEELSFSSIVTGGPLQNPASRLDSLIGAGSPTDLPRGGISQNGGTSAAGSSELHAARVLRALIASRNDLLRRSIRIMLDTYGVRNPLNLALRLALRCTACLQRHGRRCGPEAEGGSAVSNRYGLCVHVPRAQVSESETVENGLLLTTRLHQEPLRFDIVIVDERLVRAKCSPGGLVICERFLVQGPPGQPYCDGVLLGYILPFRVGSGLRHSTPANPSPPPAFAARAPGRRAWRRDAPRDRRLLRQAGYISARPGAAGGASGGKRAEPAQSARKRCRRIGVDAHERRPRLRHSGARLGAGAGVAAVVVGRHAPAGG